MSEMAGDPELQVSEMNQLPPRFLVFAFWGLEAVQEQFLFAEAKEMLQVIPLSIHLVGSQRRHFTPSLAHHYQPEGSAKSRLLGLRVDERDVQQGEGICLHG